MCVCTGEDIVFMATDIELLGNVDWVMLQSCFDAHFLLVLEKQDSSHDGVQTFFAIVQLIGTSKQAENFIYRCLRLLFVGMCGIDFLISVRFLKKAWIRFGMSLVWFGSKTQFSSDINHIIVI